VRTEAAGVAILVAALLAGCGGSSQPREDPGAFAVGVVENIVHNRYSEAWSSLHPTDQKVAPRGEYVSCESRCPVVTQPLSVKVVGVDNESVGLGDGSFVKSKAVNVRMTFAGGFRLTHTVHLVAVGGRWRFILPSWRFRDYRANRCPAVTGTGVT